ncbi:photosynthetic complex putative assembly protein PuhB [Sulfitobacter sp. D35]|uniref:photosynthetic complex putative assembly protein PuhB n=1 Tax=Sulfitobacter sp. D35 TaxID=3083252 RepID=UPI00296FBF2C|nr:photosynthetic complex putative assembly protein PuhB [Sulfitobacter sp. D35]MDW4499403.1 photosynthetic complex putative assembly protein PuhB [Sulfitobacter sp. D35]
MSHDDFAVEPVNGLPERPPEGERILWQGRPDWFMLTREALNLTWVAGYFLALGLWRFVTMIDQAPLDIAFAAAFPFAILGAAVCGLLMIVGYVQARATVYTITNRRVAMRIGAALTVTLNLPFTQIRSADLKLRGNGSGTVALDLLGKTRLSYLVCWPHVRPFVLRRTQPALRCIPDAQHVADLLAEAARTRVDMPTVTRTAYPAQVAAE